MKTYLPTLEIFPIVKIDLIRKEVSEVTRDVFAAIEVELLQYCSIILLLKNSSSSRYEPIHTVLTIQSIECSEYLSTSYNTH